MSGKGSGRRPQQEQDAVVAARWDAIFGRPNPADIESKEIRWDGEASEKAQADQPAA